MEEKKLEDFKVAESQLKSEDLKMSLRRKTIETLYETDTRVKNLLRGGGLGQSSNLFNSSTLELFISQAGSDNINIDNLIKLSNFAYATEPVYSNIVDYLSNFYLWRYYYYPIKIKDKESNYQEIYNQMTEIVDGLNLEIALPMVIGKMIREGIVYLYTVKNNTSKTIVTMLLNPKYCKPVMLSQYGTGIFRFDASYFDSLGARDLELEEILKLFPDELVTYYRNYKTTGEKFYIVDGRFSTFISLNEYNFPSKLTTLRSILDYNQYRANEVERNSSLLDKIVSHKIPSYEGNLIFDLTEVKSLHRSMSQNLNTNPRTKLLTTFGDIEVHSIQELSSVKNETLQTANKAIFNSAGINSNIFTDDDPLSLEFSIKKDGSIIWEIVQKIVNFYNLSLNNLFNFKNYQLQLSMLPISHYNQKEMMELFRKNAEYGVGKLEFIVASGTKQRDIPSKNEVENFLKLDEILIPLKSSHTRSGIEDVKEENIEENLNPKSPVKEEETEEDLN